MPPYLGSRHSQQEQHEASLSHLDSLASWWRSRGRRRGRWSELTLLVTWILVILLPLMDASPLRKNTICGPAKCISEEGDRKKFHYKEEHVYTYRYVINGTTSIDGGPSEQSGIHLASQVTLKFLSACDAILFMTDVEVWQSHRGSGEADDTFSKPDPRLTLGKALEEFPLRFSYADGVIEEMCPHPADSASALNIKKGLLSAFQNTMRRLDLEHNGEEDDVHGRCKVEYELGTATSSSLTLLRHKNIESCGDRFGVYSSVQGVPYNFGTPHQSMPAVSSLSECEQVVDRNLLSGVECRESHRLKSLSRGVAGAVTKIVQKLDLISVHKPLPTSPPSTMVNSNAASSGTGTGTATAIAAVEEDEEDETRSFRITSIASLPPKMVQVISKTLEKISRRDSLLFQNDYHLPPTRNDFGTAKKALTDFCASVKDEVGQVSGQLFDSLVHTLRTISATDMMNLAKEATEICQGDRVPFDDALEAVGTAASVEVIKDRILRKEAPVSTIKSWIASLTYIPKPDLPLMQSAIYILKARDVYPQILLSFSSLANSFCKNEPQPHTCSRHHPIHTLTQLYEKYFNATKCLAKKPKDVEQILMYLKGIGNFGIHSPGISQALRTCINFNDHIEIRLAAIEAHRRMSCESTDMTVVKQIFVNQREDTELRIAAFIAIMRCPTYSTLRFIKNILQVEEVNQVGSFVLSYLKNLQETALPSKAELQGLLADESLVGKFSTDWRKFSRNFELSTFYDDVNFGIGLDSNIIYSQNSYIPRSSSLNLTVDLFGESINVFEATVRVESLEQYVESIFGPNGKLRSKELYNIVSSFREKRAVPSKRKLRTLSLEYDAMRRYYSDPVASLSLKTFGNEILFQRKVGVAEQSELLESLNPFEYLKRLGEKDTNWQKSTMLLDSSYIIPTGAGFPLNLSAQASTILRMQAMSMMDAGNFRANSELKLKGKLQPSALLTVTGGMTLGVSDIQTGIKVRAHIRTSAAVEGSLHMKGTQLMNVEFGIPQSQVDILQYSSELLFQQGAEYKKVGKIPETAKKADCTNGFLGDLLGLKLCGSSYFSLSPTGQTDDSTAPYFPLNGPSFFTLTVEKANPNLMSTHIKYEYNNDDKSANLTGSYETVTKKGAVGTTRETAQVFGLKFNLDKGTQNFQLGLTLPQDVIDASGQLAKDVSRGRVEVSVKSRKSSSGNPPQLHGLLSFEVEKTKMEGTEGGESDEDEESGKRILRSTALLSFNNNKIIDGQSELTLIDNTVGGSGSSGGGGNGGTSFDGKGSLVWKGRRHLLEIRGSQNETSVTIMCDAQYRKHGDSSGRMETMRWKSSVSKSSQGEEDGSTCQLEASLGLELSEFPDYNLDVSWKHQRNEDGIENEAEIRQGRGPSWSDRKALRLSQALVYAKTHEGTRLKSSFQLAAPSQHWDWGFDVSLNAHGNSLDSAINLRYAPGKNLQTSLSLKRAPGVLTFLEIGWNITLPNHHHPLHLTLGVEETSHRVYESTFSVDWFGSNKVKLDLDYHDKGRRNNINKFIQLAIQTKTTDPLKLTFHLVHQEDKETSIKLGTEYGNRINSFELGHSQTMKGRRHRLYGSVQQGLDVYLVTAEVETDNGFRCVIKTDFGSKLANLHMSLRSTSENGMQLFTAEYKWDAGRDNSKQFLVDFFMDLSRKELRRSELLITYPGHQLLIGGQYTLNQDDESQVVTGTFKWDDENHLHVNAQLAPETPGKTDAFKALVHFATPFPSLKNASLAVRYDILSDQKYLINFDGLWADNERISGSITSIMEDLAHNNDGGDEDEEDGEGDAADNQNDEANEDEDVDDEGENEEDGDEGKEGGGGGEGKKKMVRKVKSHKSFAWSVKANLTSTVTALEALRFSMLHTQHHPLHLKTDIDLQFGDEKEISVASHWQLPRNLDEILSSRAEVHIKTPFVGYQNMNFQLTLGHQEDKDILAVAGLYTDTLQYSLTITGTPRFDEDGSLGFDITTSDPNYDKIFGSLSYTVGDSFRLAGQLGWPQVVIGLESGFEWGGWEEFQVYVTFNSPWMPVKNVNALAKIDTAQAEFKMEYNEKGVTAKCEWLVESFKTFEIRLDATTPLDEVKKFGMILKNALEEEESIHSQAVVWINDRQVGYKLEGEKSEVDEEVVLATIMNAQLEVDVAIYPTIRGTLTFAIREEKFNLGLSLLLREGPINVSADLHLLSVFRFNEKITITTPFPGLIELEINLNPAILPERDMYNIGVNTRWRSGSDWNEGGLQVRYGDQNALLEALTQDAADSEQFDDDQEEGDEDTNEGESDRGRLTPIKIPFSQLFHFYSPITWAKEVKVEFERATAAAEAGQSQSDNDDEEGSEQPLHSFTLAYSGDQAELSTSLRNELLLKKASARINLPEIVEPILINFEGSLDLTSDEKRMSVIATSFKKQHQEISMTATWENRTDYFKGRAELRTPFEDLEEQYAEILYAHSQPSKMYTVDVEVGNIIMGKVQSNVLLGPGSFNINVDAPFDTLRDLEIKGKYGAVEGSNNAINTLITVTSGGKEMEIDVDSVMRNKWPTQIRGTVSSSFSSRRVAGNVTANVRRTGDTVNATGNVDWGRDERLTASFFIKLPQKQFEQLEVKVETLNKNYENWQVSISSQVVRGGRGGGDDEEDQDGDGGDGGDDGDDEEEENAEEGVEKDQVIVVRIEGKTPMAPLTSFKVDGSLELGPSFLQVKKVAVNGKTPSGSLDLKTSWMIQEWNNFDFNLNSKHYILLSSSPLPKDNFAKLQFRNKIPTLDRLSLVDSLFYFETKDGRLGGAVFVKKDEEDETLTVKLDSKLPETEQSLQLVTKFDEDLTDITANLVASHGPPNCTIKSSLRLTRDENSLEGEATAEWGEDDWSSLQSRFNYTVMEEDNNKLHVELFNPRIKSRTASSSTSSSSGSGSNSNSRRRMSDGEEEEDEREVNIVLDGNFNIVSGLHDARLQTGFQKPLTVQVHVGYTGLTDINTSLNVTSAAPRYNVSTAGIQLVHKILGKTYQGVYGGHWGEDEAAISYNLKYHWQRDKTKLDGAFGAKLPFEKAQSAAIDVSYERQVMNTEGKLRAEWNSVKLIDSHYNYEALSSAGVEQEKAKLEVDNNIWPFGLTTNYQYNYSGGYQGQNWPTVTKRGLELYDLLEPDGKRLQGSIKIDTNFKGQTITLIGAHPSRQLELKTNYEFVDNKLLHNCRFTWTPRNSGIGYKLEVTNMTNEGMVEHRGKLNIIYPVREMVIESGYSNQGEGRSIKLTTDLNWNAKKSGNKLSGILHLETESDGSSRGRGGAATTSQQQQLTRRATFIVKHPSLPHDIETVGEIRVLKQESVEAKLSVDYSGETKRKVSLLLTAMPQVLPDFEWNLNTDLRLQHPATKLDLRAHHANRHSSQELSIITLIDFKNREELSKSKIAFELFKQLRKLLIMVSTPDDQIDVVGQVSGQHPNYVAHAHVNLTNSSALCRFDMDLHLDKPFYTFRLLHGQGLKDGLYSEGGVVDSRNVKFDISEFYDGFRFSDINFYLKMNHSRLITSKLNWRPDLLDDLKESYTRKREEVRDAWSQQSDKLLLALFTQASQVGRQIWEDAKTTIGPFIQEMRNATNFEDDAEAFKIFINETIKNNDFYAQEIVEFANLMAEEISVRFSNIFLRLRDYGRNLFGDSSQLFENTVLWILEKLKEGYQQLVTAWNKYRSDSETSSSSSSPASSSSSSSSFLSTSLIREKLSMLLYQIAETAAKLTEELSDTLSTYGMAMISYFDDLVHEYKPMMLAQAHKIESFVYGIVVRISDYIYATRDEMMRSAYYERLAQLGDDVDQLYKDLSKNDAPTNIRKYYLMLKNFIAKKYAEGDYGKQLSNVGIYFRDLWQSFEQTKFFQDTQKCWNSFVKKVGLVAEYLNIDETLQDALVALYMKGGDLIYQTVIEANSRYQSAKTKFIFNPDKGIMELEQKLPMPWNAFNETPAFRELPEYQNILKLQNLFQSSADGSFWDAYYKVKPETNLLNWLPPFDGHAMMVGSDHFFTFDGVAYTFRGPSCSSYLLAGDLVDGNFSVSIQYIGPQSGRGQSTSHNIVIASGPTTLIIDFAQNAVLMSRRGQTSAVQLPIQLHGLQAYRDGDLLVVESHNGMSVSCNLVYSVCQLRVSGWYSRKIGGLLGTMDFESTTDMIHSDGKPLTDLNDMTKSWDVSDDNSEPCTISTPSSSSSSATSSHKPPFKSQHTPSSSSSDLKIVSTCNKLFRYILSPLQPCFHTVNVDSYAKMCGMDSSGGAICTASMAYVSMCQSHGVIIQMPSQCIKCDMNGEEMIDRDVRVIDSTSTATTTMTRTTASTNQSSDIVFIVEAKNCNKNLRAQKKTDALIKILDREMKRANFLLTRYAVVVFGGDGAFDKPHPIMHNNEVFTGADNIGQYLNNIVVGNGSRDVFGALAYSLNELRFRPGVSKTFILFPCSSCQPQHMTMDFSAIQHAMLEQDARLHILMNNDFSLDNKNHGKKFFGLDSNLGYTKADGDKDFIRGESNIRKQVKLPKSVLGHCYPLALQTNGSIFSGKKLLNRPKNAAKLSTVFSRRVVQTASPADCQTCYCSPDHHGIGRVRCFLCGYAHYKVDVDNIFESEEDDVIHTTQLPPPSPPPTAADPFESEGEEEEEEEDDERNFSDEDEE